MEYEAEEAYVLALVKMSEEVERLKTENKILMDENKVLRRKLGIDSSTKYDLNKLRARLNGTEKNL
jgi:hypothetical protein